MPVDIKGDILKSLVEKVKIAKNGSLKELETEYGYLDFIPAKFYSEEVCIKLIRAATKVLYGKETGENLIKTGRIIGNNNISNQFAKTAFKIMSKGLFSGSYFSTFFIKITESGIKAASPSLDVKITNPDTNLLIFSFYNTKMPPEVFLGEWDEVFNKMFGEVKTEAKILSDNSFQIILKSEKFKNIEKFMLDASKD